MMITAMNTTWMTMMSSNTLNNLNTNEMIHQILYLVKYKKDFDLAAQVMIDNLISIEELNEKTLKLSQLELARIADSIIKIKR